MTGKCSDCGKEFPLEELSQLPKVQEHIRNLILHKHVIDGITDEEMNMLFCKDCLKKY